ncbi:MAG: NADH-quinone oxidoreductase subunit L [bacterium]|jgi:NADH-quinone oxidoreductase subunit L
MDFFLEKAIFIPLFPFAGFVLITFFSKVLKDRWSGNLSALVTAISAFFGIMAFVAMMGKPAGYIYEESIELFNLPSVSGISDSSFARAIKSAVLSPEHAADSHGGAGGEHALDLHPDFHQQVTAIRYNIRLDRIAAMVLFMASLTCFLIHLYSVGYMRGDKRFPRFHAFICLFTASMMGLVMAGGLLFLYVFWELMGLCSYLLIGFWYEKETAMAACKKAFITTRIGDVGFFLGIVLTFVLVGSFDFDRIWAAFPIGAAAEGSVKTWVTLAGLGLFMGTVGKSAQFPLHVWLPDAMEGPTPVSAMIHAATMVSAGVYLLGRVYPIVQASNTTLLIVAFIGGFTALIAALLGTVMNDIKKVLAYSTISQLGYMVLGLGALGWVGAMFHLITHAFFKACLFLGSGSVIIGCHHQQDMRYMGNVRKYMPITFVTFALATVALMGLPPFSGFWSKDEILASVWDAAASGRSPLYWLLFVFGAAAAFLTAFYMTRLVAMTFLGDKYRGDEAPKDEHAHDEHHAPHGALPKESPLNMTIPLMVLGTLGAFFGFAGIPKLNPWYQGFVQDGLFAHPHLPEYNLPVLGISTLMAFAGFGIGWAVFVRRSKAFAPLSARFGWLKTLLLNKYYLDDFYVGMLSPLVVRRVGAPGWSLAKSFFIFDQYVIDFAVNGAATLTRWFSILSGWFDRVVVDGLVNAVAYMWLAVNWIIRRVQSGFVATYLFVILAGIVVLLVITMIGYGFDIRVWPDMTPIGS